MKHGLQHVMYFDEVFPETSSNKDVYTNTVRPLVDFVLNQWDSKLIWKWYFLNNMFKDSKFKQDMERVYVFLSDRLEQEKHTRWLETGITKVDFQIIFS